MVSNGLDILSWVTKVRRGFRLGFALEPLLHTELTTESLDNLMEGGGGPTQCLLRRHNFFLVCQQKNGIPRLVLVFLIKRERNWNKLWSCLRDFYVSNIFQKQLHNLFQFHQKSYKKAITLLKNIGLAWHTQKKLKQASGTVWATWQKRCWNTLFF